MTQCARFKYGWKGRGKKQKQKQNMTNTGYLGWDGGSE